MANPDLKVVETLYEENARDVVAMLRKLADDVERGEYAVEMTQCVMLHRKDGDQHVDCFGWGDDGGNRLKAAGLLHAGISCLVA